MKATITIIISGVMGIIVGAISIASYLSNKHELQMVKAGYEKHLKNPTSTDPLVLEIIWLKSCDDGATHTGFTGSNIK